MGIILSAARKSLKRKAEGDLADDEQSHPKVQRRLSNLLPVQQISLLNSPDPDAVKTAVLGLFEYTKKFRRSHSIPKDLVNTIVNSGAVASLVRYLRVPPDDDDRISQYKVKKGCVFILGFIADKGPEHRQLIIDAGALSCLVDLLKRHKNSTFPPSLLRIVATTINHLACDCTIIQNLVRMEGAIPPLVELLEFNVTKVRAEPKVQAAAGLALGTLAHDNIDISNQIVECNALPTLVLMLRSKDPTIQHAAVDVIDVLVNSTSAIRKEILLAGALQPVISLLSSCCLPSQIAATTLLGNLAATAPDCKIHISQRGAIPQLIGMLKSPDVELRRMSVRTLRNLAQDPHNQASIAHNGGIEPLLSLLDSNNANLQYDAAFALFDLVVNEDFAVDFIKVGGFQKLKDGHLINKCTKMPVTGTLKMLGHQMKGRVLKQLIYLMRSEKKEVQRSVAIALAYLCSPFDRKTVFIDNNVLELLLDILQSPNIKQKGDASAVLHKLASQVYHSVFPFDTAHPPPTPHMYLGEEYVNNAKLSDVTFLVEGRTFYAHQDCLLSSDVFQAMFHGSYRESKAKYVVIPNIKWDVFETMMRFIYTGTVDVNLDIAQDLLRAADQFLLDNLKRICEYAIALNISEENVLPTYEMSEAYHATTLKHKCVLFVLKRFDKLRLKPWYCPLVHRMVPEIRMFFSTLLSAADPSLYLSPWGGNELWIGISCKNYDGNHGDIIE